MSEWAVDQLRELSLPEKVGQLVFAFTGDESGSIEQMLREGQVGAIGVGYRDARDPVALARINNRLQKMVRVPLLVKSHFEDSRGTVGGVISAGMIPNNMALGATRSPELAYRVGKIVGEESRLTGVHIPSPVVVDVNTKPDNPIINLRSFGESPDLVVQLSVALYRGLKEAGVLGMAYHFPGHGDTSSDSHMEMPVVAHPRQRFDEVDLKPYRALIAEGVEIVTGAHVHYPQLDASPGLPATLSSKILDGLLRQELGFEGLLLTDSMRMKGIASYFDEEEAVVQAVLAGNDLIMVGNGRNAYNAIFDAVQSGRITESRLDQSVRRILAAKQAAGLDRQRFVDPAEAGERVRALDIEGTALEIGRRALTCIKGRELIRSLWADSKILFAITETDPRPDGVLPHEELEDMAATRFTKASFTAIQIDPTPQETARAAQMARDADIAILAVFPRARSYQPQTSQATPGQVRLAEELAATSRLAVFCYGNPYALRSFGMADALVCAYSPWAVCLQACTEFLVGHIDATGVLPVSLHAS